MPRVKNWTQVRPQLFKGELDALPPSRRTFTYKGKKLPIDVNLLAKIAKGQTVPEGTSAITLEEGKPYVYVYTQFTEPVDLTAWDVGEGTLPGNIPNWFASNGWTNGSPFGCGWSANNVDITNGILSLVLNDTPASGLPYSSGEYRTPEFYHYGRARADIKACSEPGAMTGFFFYTGSSDGKQHHELDILEVLGVNPRQVRTNYWTNGRPHETFINMPFDLTEAFHTYEVEWLAGSITWFVDGRVVRRATEDLPSLPGRIMVNLWNGDPQATWMGPFNYTHPVAAQFTNLFFYPDMPTTGGLKNESEFILIDEQRNPLS